MDSEQRVIELEAELERLRKQVLTDELTGLPNLRSFNSALQREWDRACRDKTPLSAIFIDVDWFKAANQIYGQLRANDILRDVGKLIGMLIRSTDIATRPMGDEYVVLLPNTMLDDAGVVALKLEQAIAKAEISNFGSPERIATITSGWHTVAPDDGTYRPNKEGLINEASKHMAERKTAKKMAIAA